MVCIASERRAAGRRVDADHETWADPTSLTVDGFCVHRHSLNGTYSRTLWLTTCMIYIAVRGEGQAGGRRVGADQETCTDRTSLTVDHFVVHRHSVVGTFLRLLRWYARPDQIYLRTTVQVLAMLLRTSSFVPSCERPIREDTSSARTATKRALTFIRVFSSIIPVLSFMRVHAALTHPPERTCQEKNRTRGKNHGWRPQAIEVTMLAGA